MSRSVPAGLVTSGGGPQGLAVVRLLAEAGCRIVVADTAEDGMTAPFVDAYAIVPPVAEGPACLDALATLCARESVRLVLPATDHELELLAAARGPLESLGARVAVSDLALLRRLRDKAALYPLLADAGLPVLETVAPSLARDALPLIGKPRRGWGSRGLRLVRTAADFDAVPAAERDELVWQPFLEGAEEISADFAVGFDRSLSPIGLRRRVRVSGGFAVVSETVRDAELEALVVRFARFAAASGACGLFNVQVLRHTRRLVVSDVNPRLGTSAVHWRASGFNPVLLLCAQSGLLPPGTGGADGAPGLARPPLRRSRRSLEETIVPLGERPRVEGVVLDLDDTLIPTKRFIAARLDSALEQVAPAGELERARHEGRRFVEEGPLDRLIDALAHALGWSEEQRLALLAAYRTSWPQACPVHADVVPALDTLRSAGFRLGLLTDNPPETQRRKLEAAGLGARVDAVVYAREAGAEKPDRRGFERVAERLGLPPMRLAMAGDNPYRDLAGAAAAGYARLFWVRRAWASRGFDPALFEALPGADRYEAVADLREMLDRLRSGA